MRTAALTALLLAAVAGAQQNNADVLKQQCAGASTVDEFWHGFQGGASKNTLEGVAIAFNKTLKGQCVLPISQGNYTDLNTKLKAAFASGKVPVLAQAYENNMADYLQGGQLADLGKLGASSSGLDPVFVRANTFDGTLYGVPFNKSVQVLYYNKDLFAKYGAKAPTSMADFGKVARDLSKKAGGPVFWFAPDTSTFSAFYFTNGGTYGAGNKVVVNDPVAVKTLAMLADLVQDGAARVITQGFINAQLGSGVFGMSVDTSASYPYWEQGAKFNLGITTLPGNRPGYPGTALIQGTNVVVFQKATDAQKALAVKFLQFAEQPRNSALFATATGYVPSNTLAARQPAFQNYLTSNPNYAPVLKQQRYASFEPRIPQWQQIRFDILGKAISDATVAKVPAQTALDRAQKQVDDLLAGRTK